MAKLGDLVVNIGANTEQLNKDLKKARREMRRFGDGFKQLGEDMTKSITLPITALGALAVKSAADLETLETSFISLTGGVEQAANMMKQLTEFTAKTPFQLEAVAGAARQLIASGTEISEVNTQLQFLGDIAATSGSEINDIAAIFAKVNAKGKVELENLNQLAERGIPIFKALGDATGLLPSELGAGAISVEQFNRTLKSFADEGGFANGAMERLSQTAEGKLSTALDNLKLAGADLVEDLIPVIKDIIDGVTSMAQRFMKLDDGTKRLILVFGGLVAAIGPLLVILPKVIAQTKLLGAALKGLNPAWLAVAAGVGLATMAYSAISDAIRGLETPQDRLKKTLSEIQAEVIKTTTEAKTLVAVYKDEKTSLEERERVLKRLAEIDSEHFGNLSAETTQIRDLNEQLELYIKNVKAATVEKILQSQAEDIFNKLAQAEIDLFDAKVKVAEERQKLIEKGLDPDSDSILYDYQALFGANRALEGAQNRLAKATEELNEFEDRRTKILSKYVETVNDAAEANENLEETTESTKKTAETTGETIKSLQEKVKDLRNQLDNTIIGSKEYTKTLALWRAATLELEEATSSLNEAITEGPTDLQKIDSIPIKQLANDYDTSAKSIVASNLSIIDSFVVVNEKAIRFAQSMNDAIAGVAQSFIESTLDMVVAAMVAGQPIENFGANLLKAFGELAVQLGNIAVGFGLTVKAIKETLLSNPVLAVVGGIALIALGKAASAAADKAIGEGMPALAEGGLAFGPTTALVGDNRNASIDPEVIAPLSKLRDMLGGSTSVHGRISGDDILISNSRAMRDRNRFA